MKSKFSFLFLGIALNVWVNSNAQNMIVNGDMSTWTNTDQMIDNFGLSASSVFGTTSSAVIAKSNISYNDKNAVWIKWRAGTNSNTRGFYCYTEENNAVPAGQYIVSFVARTTTSDGWLRTVSITNDVSKVKAATLDENVFVWTSWGENAFDARRNLNLSDWTRYSFIADLPYSATQYYIGFEANNNNANGNGELHISDISMIPYTGGTRLFRSKQNGIFIDTKQWEMSENNGNTWIATGGILPTFSSAKASISHTINVHHQHTFYGELTVEVGGGLVVDAHASIQRHLQMMPGSKLTNNGSLTINTNLALPGKLSLKSDVNGSATILNSGTYTGEITAQQYLGSARNWYVSSPVVNTATPGFTTTPDFTGINYYYEYIEAGDNDPDGQPGSPTLYWKGVDKGQPMAVGKGYIAKANAGTTISFTGIPNNGNITTEFDLTRDDAKGKGFNLVGNPYPSYIDWSDVAAANANIDNTYYYRTKNIDNSYAFVTWNGAGNTFVNSRGGTANTTITRFIPPTQAFWVRVKTGTSATKMYFNNDMREHGINDGNLMKAPRQDTRTSVRLQLINGTERDELLIYQDAGASNEYDSYDSPKILNNSSIVPDLYSIAGDERLVINGLNAITENMELPLGFTLKSAAMLKMKATELNNLPEGMQVYLLDKTANTQTQLTPETDYSFTTTEATTNNESRFSLLFKAPGAITGIGESNQEKERISVFVNSHNEIVIRANEDISFSIYNVAGQQIVTGKTKSNSQSYTSKLSTGVYLVRVGSVIKRLVIR
jgi:hypothetical protein